MGVPVFRPPVVLRVLLRRAAPRLLEMVYFAFRRHVQGRDVALALFLRWVLVLLPPSPYATRLKELPRVRSLALLLVALVAPPSVALPESVGGVRVLLPVAALPRLPRIAH